MKKKRTRKDSFGCALNCAVVEALKAEIKKLNLTKKGYVFRYSFRQKKGDKMKEILENLALIDLTSFCRENNKDNLMGFPPITTEEELNNLVVGWDTEGKAILGKQLFDWVFQLISQNLNLKKGE